ncbi:MAG: hypothetical protein V4654_08095 [Bdellovibrionota bacterium]
MTKKAIYKKIFFIFIFNLMAVAAQGETQCSKTVFFLPQSHNKNFGTPLSAIQRADLENLSRSQFEVAQFVEQNSQLPVFVEGLYQDVVVSEKSNFSDQIKNWAKQLTKIEPLNNSSGRFEDLSQADKELLAQVSGPFSMLFLGKINAIYKTIEDKKMHDAEMKAVNDVLAIKEKITVDDDEAMDAIFRNRDKGAINHIITFFNKHPDVDEAVLVFGARHDFIRYSGVVPGLCFQVPPAFAKKSQAVPYKIDPNGLLQLK